MTTTKGIDLSKTIKGAHVGAVEAIGVAMGVASAGDFDDAKHPLHRLIDLLYEERDRIAKKNIQLRRALEFAELALDDFGILLLALDRTADEVARSRSRAQARGGVVAYLVEVLASVSASLDDKEQGGAD